MSSGLEEACGRFRSYRLQELAAKARKGELIEPERSELEDHKRVASLLELLQSKARLSLKRAGLSP